MYMTAEYPVLWTVMDAEREYLEQTKSDAITRGGLSFGRFTFIMNDSKAKYR